MKTFVDFITEAPTEAQAAKMAPGMAPEKRRAALERNARNQARRDTPTTPQEKVRRPPQKKLPPSNSSALATRPPSALATRPSSALATRPADKGASIVRHKNQQVKDREDAKISAKQKLASGSAGEPKLKPRSPKKAKKPNNIGKNLSKVAGGVAKAGVGLAKRVIDSTKGTSVGTSSSGNLGGPNISQGGRTSK